MERVKFVGLDVHAETIAVAVAEQGEEVRSLGVIPNREESVRKLVRKLGPVELLKFCYEEHVGARIARLDGAIEEAVKLAPPQMRAVIEALQALRGIAHVSAPGLLEQSS
jgi:hypothetical protein